MKGAINLGARQLYDYILTVALPSCRALKSDITNFLLLHMENGQQELLWGNSNVQVR